MPLRILINGAGICGPAICALLLRSTAGHTITVVERSPSLRTGGQQIDLREQGIPVMRMLGLLETVRVRTVDEKGLIFIDANGSEKAVFGVNDSGKGPQAFTSEFEIMRGDLVDVLYEGSKKAADRNLQLGHGGGLQYEFGKYANSIIQSDSTVKVEFSDGSSGEYDLVIGADGQGSRTRRMVFGGEDVGVDVSFKFFGLYVAYFTIPKSDKDKKDNTAKCFHVPNSKVISIRTGHKDVTQVVFGILAETKELQEAMKQPVEKQKDLWAGLFKGSGWQTDRLLDGMMKTDDFYMQPVGQIKTEQWSKGRVVLLGDAGYCPSPISGLGTTVSLVGAYVLAGELARHGDNVHRALEAYENVLRPFITDSQNLPSGLLGFAYPKSGWGITFMHTILGIASKLNVEMVVRMLRPNKEGRWKLPDYPELKLEE